MENTDFEAARNFIESKATALYHHEKKDFAVLGYPSKNYTEYKRGTRIFYAVASNVFSDTVEMDLVTAQKQFPLNFGNGNAICVIHALEKLRGFIGGTKRATRFFQSESCCWVLEIAGGVVVEKVLRIDLFRKLDRIRNKKRKYEFTGGVLHAFKHFSYRGKPLSTGTDINELYPKGFVGLVLNAFFLAQGAFIDPLNQTYVSRIKLNDKYNLKFVFYREVNTNVYFVKTVHKEPI